MRTYIDYIPELGRGVFAAEDIQKGEIIEVSPVIVIPQEEVEFLDRTLLERYYYSWGRGLKSAAVALGHGSLYNHSYNPNARYIKCFDQGTIEFICIRDIARGEEIRVNYNGSPGDVTPVWFEVK